jgi:predicted nucleic acid-binding protein
MVLLTTKRKPVPADRRAESVRRREPVRALAIAIELHHPAYDCFYLALAEQNNSSFVTADDRLIRRCAGTPFEKLVQSL